MLPTLSVSLPKAPPNDPTAPYRAALRRKSASLAAKRAFDAGGALFLLLLLSPLLLLLAAAVALDSRGGPFFVQTRLTKGERPFRMLKLRTMARDCGGVSLTLQNDARVTRVGRFLRKTRLDELPQLINVLTGDMSFVGPRPEVPRYLDSFDPQMRALFLVRAGVTSRTSLLFSDEAALLAGEEPERVYRDLILPRKNGFALQELLDFSLGGDLAVLIKTAKLPFQGAP